MTKVRKFTFEEREVIEELLKEGESRGSIATFLQRSPHGIRHEVKFNSINGVYKAKEAQEISSKRKCGPFSKVGGRAKLVTRIESLEMQIEILHDAIKELMK